MLPPSIVVLPRGYVGKRVPESWSLQQVINNMELGLLSLSHHHLNHNDTSNPKRARLRQGCHGCAVEYLKDDPEVLLFYDWDRSLSRDPEPTELRPLHEISSKAELQQAERIVLLNQAQDLVKLENCMRIAHPDLSETDFAYAGRSGWKFKRTGRGSTAQTSGSWVISLRCFVQTRMMKLSDIATHINNTFGEKPSDDENLDRSVYKPSEQCLALVGGHKTINDQRVLIPITHRDNLAAFVVQNTAGCTLIQPNREPIITLPRTISSASSVDHEPTEVDARKRRKTAPSDPNPSSTITDWLHEQFGVEKSLIHIDKKKSNVIPTSSKDCPFIKREHTSNHVYFTVTVGMNRVNVHLKCHDSECAQNSRAASGAMSPDVDREFRDLFGDEHHTAVTIHQKNRDPVTTEMKQEVVLNTLTDIKKKYPKMDCTVLDCDILQPTSLGPGGFLTLLKHNFWCPLHIKMHDSWQNCVLMTSADQQLICKQDMTRTLPLQVDKAQINVVFANNINVNVTSGTDALEIRDFGSHEVFPVVHEESADNKACYVSLSGHTRDVAHYAVKLMKNTYIFQQKTWYRYKENYWKVSPGPHDLLTIDMVKTYESLQSVYTTEKQIRWLQSLISDLKNMTKRKVIIEDMESIVAEHFPNISFDESSHLIGLQNGVFDSRDCCFREHRVADYLTLLLPYDLPDEVDKDLRREINEFFEGIMPDSSVRDYLWLMLAFHLAGENEKSVAMIWTGTGGNGKSILKRLMQLTFAFMHSEPTATFLTSERPSPERPAPHLVNLRNCRSVFASEPEAHKKINTGFLKFITGDDRVECRACHSNDIVSFYPRFLITLLCNAIPLFDGGGDEVRGLWRRLHIISFGQEFVANPHLPHQKKEDPTLKKRMERWPPQFMKMLIEVFTNYVNRGRTLSIPKTVQMNLEEQKEENSPIDNWLKHNLQKETGRRIHLHRLTKTFENSFSQSRVPTPTPTVLEQKLKNIGFNLTKNNQRNRDKDCTCNRSDRYVEDAKFREDD